VGGPDGVNPYKIVLLNQLFQPCSVRFVNYIGVRRHVGWIKLEAEPLGKATAGPAHRDWQRAYDSPNFEFAFGWAYRFLVFKLGGNNHEGHIPETAQQFSDIQHALLCTVGRRQGPVGCHK
jgi:hypothetical protein